MMQAAEIRQKFLDFFKTKQHQIVASAPIVVKNDPTLLFTNAGMNQFKDYFLGVKKPDYTRIANTQKCLRVSGKHNDLEEVGVDTYHHTMFEMLGNWSFGDYFKAEAIAWSWELLTEVYKIDKSRLYVTVFEGDEKEGLPPSKIALTEWKKIVPEDRIVFGNKKDNFWEMGDTGPCGPCSEIHVDLRSQEEINQIPGRELVNKDHPQVIEIWNNVFIQYNRKKDGSLEELPDKHVDTGMGLERLVRVIQGKKSNYDTDLFTSTIHATEQITQKTYLFGDSKPDVAFRVIADHIRAIAFTIADGQMPSNTGAGYVIRRILRRAVRYYYSYLDYKIPLLHKLIPQLASQFEHVFPELQQQADFVSKVIKEEEEAFLRTLDKGLKKMDEIIAKEQTTKLINGKEAFELFDTYGFPIDLTRLIAVENNMQIDEVAFNEELQIQKNRSRAASAIDTDDWIILSEQKSVFVGYKQTAVNTSINRYRRIQYKGKEQYQIVLEETPFYAESGGQVGDTGVLIIQDKEFAVIDTKKENDLIIHFVNELPSAEIISSEVSAVVQNSRRNQIAIHHSATHLLHAALRQILGKHVAQKGSLVNEQHLRFDFSHYEKLSDADVAQIEALVNEKIRQNIQVHIEEMDKEQALKLGAMALFGEKYGDKVRVVMMDTSYSVELCGGTHVASTGELGFFKIKHESAVAAGVRRIEAVAGKACELWLNAQLVELHQIKHQLKNPKDVLKAITDLQAENSSLKKQNEHLEEAQLKELAKQAITQKKHIQTSQFNNLSFLPIHAHVSSADALKKLCFECKQILETNFVVLATATIEGKPFVCLCISENESQVIQANQVIKQVIAPLIKGGGGGQKNLATAGGQDASNLSSVGQKVTEYIMGL